MTAVASITPDEFMSSAPATAVGGSTPWAALALPSSHTALFDVEDRETVERYSWHALKARNTFYVQTGGGGRPHVYLHRLLMGAGPGQLVDHRNRNGLDNRRQNLRLCTRSQNSVNAPGRAGYRGVAYHPNNHANPWRARLKSVHLGYFATEWLAAEAYNAAATKAYGEFAG